MKEYVLRMKTYTNEDTFGVANTLMVDVHVATSCIAALKGLTIDEICIYDNLT